jgi:hypothetical protein
MKSVPFSRTLFLCTVMTIVCYNIGCGPTIAVYDQYSYTQATSVKVDALNVVAMGTEDYASHQKDATALKLEIQKIYEYDKNLPKNAITTKQWEIVIDSSGHSMGGFLYRWQKEGKLGAAFVNDKKVQIGADFDQIIQLEAAKIKSSK